MANRDRLLEARRLLDEKGYVCITHIFPPDECARLFDSVADELRVLTAGKDVCRTDCRMDELGVRISTGWTDVYHGAVANRMREMPRLVQLFWSVTGVKPRFSLTESYHLRVPDACASGIQSTPCLAPTFVSYDAPEAPIDAPYRMFVFLTEHAADNGAFEVIPRSRTADCQPQAKRRRAQGAPPDQREWVVVDDASASHITRVSVQRGSVMIVHKSTLHRMCEWRFTGAFQPRLIVPVTFLPDSECNRAWMREWQHPAAVRRLPPGRKPSGAGTLESHAVDRPRYIHTQLGQWLSGLQLDSGTPPNDVRLLTALCAPPRPAVDDHRQCAAPTTSVQ